MSELCTWIYVVADYTGGAPKRPIKVGISDEPTSRLRTIQTGCPSPLIEVARFRFKTRKVAADVEGAFHKYNSGFRTSGEWFDIDPASAVHMIITIIQSRCEMHDIDPKHAESLLNFAGGREYAEGVIRRLRGWRFTP
ncbi:GIY-YIG nuclease family protein [Methylorubrum suomiense]|uniref:GIY-YIG nuclease family protein n=1 Tax=Methylorubrum suomiense TaxID=144191 RepID=A0ABQ4UZA2_9HYPH|nr:GIY-YIG nuclease family protein [Methylorubrum suomiense]GJE77224.1 hypothetical protein BGCPKDLD_3827 [Methylorubrum suomiense]